MKKIIAIVMVVSMLMAVLATYAYADGNDNINILFSDNMEGGSIKGFAQNALDFKIAEAVGGRAGKVGEVSVKSGNSAGYFALRDGWNVPSYTTFENFTFSKRIVFSVDIYLSEELRGAIGSGEIRGKMNGGSGSEVYQTRGFGRFSITASKNGTGYTITEMSADTNSYITSNVKELTCGWHTFVWSYMPEADSAQFYIDSEFFAEPSGVNGDMKISAAKSKFEGLRFDMSGFSGVDKALYLDNFVVYQPVNTAAFTASFDEKTSVLQLNSATLLDESVLSAFTIKSDGGKATAYSARLMSDKKTVEVTFAENVLKAATQYNIIFDDHIRDAYFNVYSPTEPLYFITHKATTLNASLSFKDGDNVKPDMFVFDVIFTGEVAEADFNKYFSIKDEEGTPVEYVSVRHDSGYEITLRDLNEYSYYTVKIDAALKSVDLLPIEREITAMFATVQRDTQPPDDPYIPDKNSDIVLHDGTDNTPSLFKDTYNVDSITDDEGEYIILKSGETNIPFEVDGLTADKTDRYGALNDDIIVVKTVVKLPSDIPLAASNSSDKNELLKLTFSVTPADLNKSETITINNTPYHKGQWGTSLNVAYTDGKLVTYKSNSTANIQTLKTANELALGTWLDIEIKIETATGIAKVSIAGASAEVDMNIGPNWGETAISTVWTQYMYLSSMQFNVCSSGRTETKLGVRDIFVERLSNTLSVTNASFIYGENYADTENMWLEFNDNITDKGISDCIAIYRNDGTPVENSISSVNVDKNRMTVTLTGLKPYTEYYITVFGAETPEGRKMRQSFSRAFTTRKASRIFIDIKDDDAVLDTYGRPLKKADKISCTVVIKNPDELLQDIQLMAGLYGADNTLSQLQLRRISVSRAKQTETFQFIDVPPGTADIKLYAFSDDKLTLLHEPDSVVDGKNIESVKTSVVLPEISVKISDSAKGILEVSSSCAVSDLPATIIVLSGENTDISEFEAKAVAVGHSITASDGFGTSFAIDKASGMYTAYIAVNGESYSKTFEYISLEDVVNKLIDKIADGTVSKDSIFDKIKEMNAGIGLDLENEFVSLRDKNLLNRRISEARALLLTGTNAEKLEKFNNTIKHVQNELDYLNRLSEVKYYGMIVSTLEEGAAYTGIDFGKFNKLSSAQKSELASTMLGMEYSSAEEVKQKFDMLVSELSKKVPDEPYNGKGGSGGGGGGSASGKFVPGDMPVNPNINPPLPENIFSDMTDFQWANSAVCSLARQGIVNGVSEGIFEPGESITREQFAKMAVLALNLYNENAESDFEDIESGSWYARYVASAVTGGLINGNPDNTFGVGADITRQDIAVIIYRAFAMRGVAMENKREDFIDMQEIDDYAYDAVAYLTAKSVINGTDDKRFEPKRRANRAEAAVLIYAMQKECESK